MMLMRVLMIMVLLGVSPAARAVECLMGPPAPPVGEAAALDPAHADCPMMRDAVQRELPAPPMMTVADCFHDIGLVAVDAAVTSVDTVPVVLPALPAAIPTTFAVPLRVAALHPPPLMAPRHVLLTSGRWRI